MKYRRGIWSSAMAASVSAAICMATAGLLMVSCAQVQVPTLTALPSPARDDPFLTPLREPALDTITGCNAEIYRLLVVPMRDHVWTVRLELAGDSVRVATKTLSGLGGYDQPKHELNLAVEKRQGRAVFDSVSWMIDSANAWALPEAAHGRRVDATTYILEIRQGCKYRRLYRESGDSSDAGLNHVFKHVSAMAHGTHPQ